MGGASERWLDAGVRTAVLARSDGEGLGRDDGQWAAGGDASPPVLLPAQAGASRARVGGAVGEVLAGVLAGEPVEEDEIVTLFGARGP